MMPSEKVGNDPQSQDNSAGGTASRSVTWTSVRPQRRRCEERAGGRRQVGTMSPAAFPLATEFGRRGAAAAGLISQLHRKGMSPPRAERDYPESERGSNKKGT